MFEWGNVSSNWNSGWTLCCTAHKHILWLQCGFSCDQQGFACLQMSLGTSHKVFVWPFSFITSSLSGLLAMTDWSSQNMFYSSGLLSLSQKWKIVVYWPSFHNDDELDGAHITKHCQRHNGPEGSVLLTKVTALGHITNYYTNLDQTSSESRPNTNFKISTKHQHYDKT